MSEVSPLADERTIAIYSQQAEAYAAREVPERSLRFLNAFMAELPPGGRVLDLGCGAGWASENLSAAGFDAFALDACPELAAIASRRLRRPVLVMPFEAIEHEAFFDGIFALNSIHHIPKARLPALLARLGRALKPGGLLFVSVKEGEEEVRDTLGRYYAHYSLAELRALAEAEPRLEYLRHLTAAGIDFAGEAQIFHGIVARRRLS